MITVNTTWFVIGLILLAFALGILVEDMLHDEPAFDTGPTDANVVRTLEDLIPRLSIIEAQLATLEMLTFEHNRDINAKLENTNALIYSLETRIEK